MIHCLNTSDAYRMIHKGQLVLSRMEHNGVRIDLDHFKRAKEEAREKIKEVEADLLADDVGKVWSKRYGSSLNFASSDQAREVLYKDIGLKTSKLTKTGKASVDRESIEDAAWHLPFGKMWVRHGKLDVARKQLNTVGREIWDGHVHANHKLNTVKTWRSSCSNPNLMGLCGRDAESAPLVRGLFIPSHPGWVFWEADLRQAEVCGSVWYNQDPVLQDYVADKSKDMHRDAAMRLYCIDDPNLVVKPIRQMGKNRFVFPEFYGDYWGNCAKYLWRAVEREDLKLADGTDLKIHLHKQGIAKLGDLDEKGRPQSGTFMHHVREVERGFWSKFSVYAEWKMGWYELYKKRGWFPYLTGFVSEGVFKKNFVTNAPVQGSSFHYLLTEAILVDRELRRRKFKTKLITEIHDSLVGCSPVSEIQDVLELIDHVVSVEVKKDWPFVTTDMEVEFSVCPPDQPWSKKEDWVKVNGTWGPKKKKVA